MGGMDEQAREWPIHAVDRQHVHIVDMRAARRAVTRLGAPGLAAVDADIGAFAIMPDPGIGRARHGQFTGGGELAQQHGEVALVGLAQCGQARRAGAGMRVAAADHDLVGRQAGCPADLLPDALNRVVVEADDVGGDHQCPPTRLEVERLGVQLIVHTRTRPGAPAVATQVNPDLGRDIQSRCSSFELCQRSHHLSVRSAGVIPCLSGRDLRGVDCRRPLV